MVVLLEGSPISTEELWSSVRVTIRFLVTSLTRTLLSWLLSLAGRPGLGRVLMVPNFFHLGMMEATVLGDLQCCRIIFVTFPRSVPWHNSVSELYEQLIRPHCLVFALTCTINCETLNRQVCAFPINGNGMHLSLISSLIAEGSEYLGK